MAKKPVIKVEQRTIEQSFEVRKVVNVTEFVIGIDEINRYVLEGLMRDHPLAAQLGSMEETLSIAQHFIKSWDEGVESMIVTMRTLPIKEEKTNASS